MATTKTDIPLHMLAVTSGAVLTAKTGAKLLEFDVPPGATSAASTGYFEFEASGSAAAPIEIAAAGAFANTSIALAPKGTGQVRVLGNSTSAGGIRFYEDTDLGSNYVGIRMPGNTNSTWDLTLPKSSGSTGFALVGDGDGALTWRELLTTTLATKLNLQMSSGALEIDVATGDASIIFDTAGVDRWTMGAASSGNIFSMPAIESQRL